MTPHKKHIFTFVIVVVLCVLAGVLWIAVHHATTPIPLATTQGSLGSNPTVLFTEPDASFSFSMPADMHFSTGSSRDANGTLVETNIFNGGTEERNFVIRIALWTSFDPITPAFIEQNTALGPVSDTGNISVDGASGAAFTSTDPVSGLRSREIWFARAGKLYQITTYPSFNDELVNILATWQWASN